MRLLRPLQRFWLALRLTWRGEKVPRTTLALHWDWLEEAERLLRAFITSLKQHPPETSVRLRYDGRELLPTTALRWLSFSFQRELPSLLRSGNPHARAAFQAQVLNLRDMLSAWRNSHAPADAGTMAALASLIEHLYELPSDDNGAAAVVATLETKRYTAPHESPLSEREMPAMPPKPEDSGQSLLEYALILVLVAVVVIVILVLLGPTIREIINNIVNSIAT